MVRPWVVVSKCQYEQLKKLKEKTGKPVSMIIQEAVSDFVRKKEYRVGIASSYLPRASRDNCRTLTAYVLRSDWNLLGEISRNTGRSKTELIRKALDEYMRELS